MVKAVAACNTASALRNIAVLRALDGTNSMSSACKGKSDTLACRIFFKGRAVSCMPRGVFRMMRAPFAVTRASSMRPGICWRSFRWWKASGNAHRCSPS